MSIALFTLILVTVWGACVGSFLNVVIYRVPEGMSVVSPPSRCPGCEKKLAIYDNVPVLGWLWLRGRCRYCKMKISVQYPLVEAATALLFGGVTYAYYFTGLREVFTLPGIGDTWAVLAVHLVLIAMMVGATMIDAKLYIIPLSLPWVATAVAAVVLPVSVAVGWTVTASQASVVTTGQLLDDYAANGYFSLLGVWLTFDTLLPFADGVGTGAALGGTLGLVLSIVLLRLKVLKLSFADEIPLPEGADPDDPNLILAHPHPRREVMKEVVFLIAPTLGILIGGYAGYRLSGGGAAMPSPWLSAVGGVLLGYLFGGGIVWATRILGTLGFGKEAMGLGDVHLLAAIGAVIGWRDTTLVFFIAPFFGIVAAVLMAGIAALVKGKVRVIPYGPYLCGAAVVVMLWRTPIWGVIFP
ncbi:MAG: prepilin peptidase [Planctomycetota bacterium]